MKLAIEIREVQNGYVVYPPMIQAMGSASSYPNQHVAATIPDLCKLVDKLAKEAKAKQAE